MKATRSRAWRVGGGGDGVGSVTLGDFHEYLAVRFCSTINAQTTAVMSAARSSSAAMAARMVCLRGTSLLGRPCGSLTIPGLAGVCWLLSPPGDSSIRFSAVELVRRWGSAAAATHSGSFNATVCHPPAAIATTPLKPAGTLVWPYLLSPHATTVPSCFNATV